MTEIGADGCGCCTAPLLGRSCICHDKAEARDEGLCPSVYCPLPRPYPQPELPQSPLPTQTHAPGRLLSRAGTRAPFPPWRTITLAVGFALREWCQHGGLACNSPLLQAGARTHTHTRAEPIFPAPQYQMDGNQGRSQVQITSCSWAIQSRSSSSSSYRGPAN